MTTANLDATPLVDEYRAIVEESTKKATREIDWNELRRALVQTADWTDDGAAHFALLVRTYGAFVLRNALALAVAAEIEDGELGL